MPLDSLDERLSVTVQTKARSRCAFLYENLFDSLSDVLWLFFFLIFSIILADARSIIANNRSLA